MTTGHCLCGAVRVTMARRPAAPPICMCAIVKPAAALAAWVSR